MGPQKRAVYEVEHTGLCHARSIHVAGVSRGKIDSDGLYALIWLDCWPIWGG